MYAEVAYFPVCVTPIFELCADATLGWTRHGCMELLPTGVVSRVIHDHEKKRPKNLEQLGEFCMRASISDAVCAEK